MSNADYPGNLTLIRMQHRRRQKWAFWPGRKI